MALDDEGLSLLWSRIAMYVNAYVAGHGGVGDIATVEHPGAVMPDGQTITIDQYGTIRGASIATYDLPGIVMPDGRTIWINENGVISGFDLTTARLGSIGYSDKISATYLLIGDDSDGEYYLPADVSLPVSAFINCNIVTATLPALSSVPGTCFQNCSRLTRVSIPKATSIGVRAFAWCQSLTGVYGPNVGRVYSQAFVNCTSLESISLPTCTLLSNTGAFANCNALSNVYLPMCSSVGTRAFNYCTSLSEIALPECRYIGAEAFSGCYTLSKLDLAGVSQVVSLNGSNAFSSTPLGGFSSYTGGYGSVLVPMSLYQDFATHNVWRRLPARFVAV